MAIGVRIGKDIAVEPRVEFRQGFGRKIIRLDEHDARLGQSGQEIPEALRLDGHQFVNTDRNRGELFTDGHPVGPISSTSPVNCCLRPATRTMKNSSRLLDTIA